MYPIYDLRSFLPPPLPYTKATGMAQPKRTETTNIILHYNGPPAPDRAGGSRDEIIQWLRDVIIPSHIQRIQADGVQYHLWVARDGTVYQLRNLDQGLWHCGNWQMNNRSIAVHIPIGGYQHPTTQQWDAATSLIDDLIVTYQLPGRHVVLGHREVGASECPGVILMPMLQQWRQEIPSSLLTMQVVQGIKFANVRTSPRIPNYGEPSNIAMIGNDPVRLVPGFVIRVSPHKHQDHWFHIEEPAPWGFIHDSLLVRVNDTAPVGPPLTIPTPTEIPQEDLVFIHEPRISLSLFTEILNREQSPAAIEADAMYNACVSTSVDPALLLAFFRQESGYGKYGLCATYRLNNPGNVRTAVNPSRGEQLDIPSRGKFFRFRSWQLGALDWAERMRDWYGCRWGLYTVRAALPKYAPATDQNNPDQYAQNVIQWVREWQKSEMSRT